jgi:hypothetical protein
VTAKGGVALVRLKKSACEALARSKTLGIVELEAWTPWQLARLQTRQDVRLEDLHMLDLHEFVQKTLEEALNLGRW